MTVTSPAILRQRCLVREAEVGAAIFAAQDLHRRLRRRKFPEAVYEQHRSVGWYRSQQMADWARS
jgi:hypothetical protein